MCPTVLPTLSTFLLPPLCPQFFCHLSLSLSVFLSVCFHHQMTMKCLAMPPCTCQAKVLGAPPRSGNVVFPSTPQDKEECKKREESISTVVTRPFGSFPVDKTGPSMTATHVGVHFRVGQLRVASATQVARGAETKCSPSCESQDVCQIDGTYSVSNCRWLFHALRNLIFLHQAEGILCWCQSCTEASGPTQDVELQPTRNPTARIKTRYQP